MADEIVGCSAYSRRGTVHRWERARGLEGMWRSVCGRVHDRRGDIQTAEEKDIAGMTRCTGCFPASEQEAA